jgi:hypothetical protein
MTFCCKSQEACWSSKFHGCGREKHCSSGYQIERSTNRFPSPHPVLKSSKLLWRSWWLVYSGCVRGATRIKQSQYNRRLRKCLSEVVSNCALAKHNRKLIRLGVPRRRTRREKMIQCGMRSRISKLLGRSLPIFLFAEKHRQVLRVKLVI